MKDFPAYEFMDAEERWQFTAHTICTSVPTGMAQITAYENFVAKMNEKYDIHIKTKQHAQSQSLHL